uniref:Uncharacterized protein n=2 Tax=Hanusia phi TaxID=3032 RepID=A0A7S0E902_9CRYP|mmetsp:Transcript_1828/g.3997  ORF Transcript_1828/g.3997 Transcript_1828/m.3997 type:complete len:107 (+) Transcript_1828:269-589(+)
MLEILQEKKRISSMKETMPIPPPPRRRGLDPAPTDPNEEQISVVTKQLNDLIRLKKKSSSKKPDNAKASSNKTTSKPNAKLKLDVSALPSEKIARAIQSVREEGGG